MAYALNAGGHKMKPYRMILLAGALLVVTASGLSIYADWGSKASTNAVEANNFCGRSAPVPECGIARRQTYAQRIADTAAVAITSFLAILGICALLAWFAYRLYAWIVRAD
jgi:hypothetical protein